MALMSLNKLKNLLKFFFDVCHLLNLLLTIFSLLSSMTALIFFLMEEKLMYSRFYVLANFYDYVCTCLKISEFFIFVASMLF